MRAGSCQHHSVKEATGNGCYVSRNSLEFMGELGVSKAYIKSDTEH